MYYSFIYTRLHLWFSYAFKVCSKSVSEIQYICPVIIVGAVIMHKMFDPETKHLSATDGQLKVFQGPWGWRNSFFNSPLCTFTSVTMPTHQNVSKIQLTSEKQVMFFISISSGNDLLKSNWRNSLSSLVSLWAILLQDIGTKWWLLLVSGTVFDLAKQSSRLARKLTICSWVTPKMWWKEFILHIYQALVGSSKFHHVGVFVNYILQHEQIPQHQCMVNCHG